MKWLPITCVIDRRLWWTFSFPSITMCIDCSRFSASKGQTQPLKLHIHVEEDMHKAVKQCVRQQPKKFVADVIC
jgi:hypothetical protein